MTALLARWTEKLAGGPQAGTSDSPPLARVMGVGRQQQHNKISETIHELSPNSAAGYDCVPSSLLTNCATELAPVLLLIFSQSLSHGVIPESWKRAAVIPIYKSVDKTVPSNYRPISLTSVICKVLEIIIRKQIYIPSLIKMVGLTVPNIDLGLVVHVYLLYWMFLIILCTC